MEQAQNLSEAMSYVQEAKKRSKGNICEKHKAAAPYYFFLTSVTDSIKTHSEPLSLQMFGKFVTIKIYTTLSLTGATLHTFCGM